MSILLKDFIKYAVLVVLPVAACVGFACGFELLSLLSLASLAFLLALKFEKPLFYFLIATMPISLELIHTPKDLLSGLTGGINANGLFAILMVCIVLPVISFRAFKADWRPSSSVLFFAAYIAWVALTISYSEFPLVGIKYVGYLLYPLTFFVLVQFLIATGKINEGKVFVWMLASAVVSAVVGYLLFVFDLNLISIHKAEYVFGTALKRFRNPLGYGSSHWALGMALYAFIAAESLFKEANKRIFYISALLISSASMVLTYTRIPFTAVVLSLLSMTLLRRKIVLSALICVLAMAVLIFTPMGLRFNLFGSAIDDFEKAEKVIEESRKRVGETTKPEEALEPTKLDERRLLFQTALSGRGLLFKTSLNLAWNAPFWGYGAGTGDYRLASYVKEEMGVVAPVINIHSVVLRSRIETGYPGIVLLAAFMIALFIELIRNRKRGNRYAALGILVYIYFGMCLLVEPLLGWYRFSFSIFFVFFAIAFSGRDIAKRG